MIKKNCLKPVGVVVVIFLCIFLFSIKVQGDTVASNEGPEWLVSDNDFGKGTNTDTFKGYTKVASTMLMIIPLVVVALYVVKKKYGIKTSIGRGNKHIKIIDHTSMGVKKSIFLVKIPGKHLLIGVSNDKIGLITEISNEDVEDKDESRKKDENITNSEFLSLMKKSYLRQKQK